MKCGLIKGNIRSNRKLCSFHFAETDFGKGVKKRSLKSNAIPTIFEEDRLRHEIPSTYFEGRVKEHVSIGLNFISYNCLSNITNVINIRSTLLTTD